ncbi:DUF3159 domain-containing protein [Pseudonocardia sp. ICBG1293]|uniref:DUF3159 domain-containing protein n=1 Tax=Pseudonocardia sp. ICBG1293 TaxID=2844382 RepID=UPI0027DF2E1C|nr:DUF3159 domain-containing protein [Pseudonocardia sp. ICBG1293]
MPPCQNGRPVVRPHDMRRHLADAAVPTVAFLVGNGLSGVQAGVIAAVAAGSALAILRVTRRQRPTVVVAAFGVVLVQAAVVTVTGEGRDYFLNWLLFNIALALVCAGSLVVNRPITMRLERFAGVTDDVSRHRTVTLLWAGFGLARLAVAMPLYSTNMVVALGAAKVVLGPPALLLLGMLSWRLLTRVPAG